MSKIPEIGDLISNEHDRTEAILHLLFHRHLPLWIVTASEYNRWSRTTEITKECAKCETIDVSTLRAKA